MKYILCLLIVLFFVVFPIISRSRVERVSAAEDSSAAAAVVQASFNAWIDNLGQHEACPREGMVDSNGQLSYGRFCYQAGTFIVFVKKFNLMPGAEDAEIMNMIGDEAFERSLTVLEFRHDPRAWWHWQTTVGKIGMPPL